MGGYEILLVTNRLIRTARVLKWSSSDFLEFTYVGEQIACVLLVRL